MANVFDKQNDVKNLKYLWASEYCFVKKSHIVYFQTIMSFLMPVLSIINKYIPYLFSHVEQIKNVSELLSQIIVLLSGFVIILQIFLSIWAKRWSLANATLWESYDVNVFNLFQNKSIMASISYNTMLTYANKYKKKKSLEYLYFETADEAENKYSHFNAIKKSIECDYYNMVAFKKYMTGFCVSFVILLLVFAFAINPTWKETVIYIFVPSLSAISLIAQTWNNYNSKMNFLDNMLHVINEYARKKYDSTDTEGPSSRVAMRSLQDALFFHRHNDFPIPKFLLKRFNKLRCASNPTTKTCSTPVKSVAANDKYTSKQNIQNTESNSISNSIKNFFRGNRAVDETLRNESVASLAKNSDAKKTVNRVKVKEKTSTAEVSTNNKKIVQNSTKPSKSLAVDKKNDKQEKNKKSPNISKSTNKEDKKPTPQKDNVEKPIEKTTSAKLAAKQPDVKPVSSANNKTQTDSGKPTSPEKNKVKTVSDKPTAAGKNKIKTDSDKSASPEKNKVKTVSDKPTATGKNKAKTVSDKPILPAQNNTKANSDKTTVSAPLSKGDNMQASEKKVVKKTSNNQKNNEKTLKS